MANENDPRARVNDVVIANVSAILKPYFSKSSDSWTWELALLAIARLTFGAPRDAGPPLEFEIRGKRYLEEGSSSITWNTVIVRAGARVRQAENPHPNDYKGSNYAGAQALRRVASLVAQTLVDEMSGVGL